MGALDAWNIRVLYLHCICFINYYDIIIMIIPNVLVFTDGLLMGNKTALHLLANKDCTAMSFQSCPTLCDPIAAHQAPPSLGFSRQEYWSGLPFPSPGHKSEK